MQKHKVKKFQVLTAATMKMRAFWDVRHVVLLKKTDVSQVRAAYYNRPDDGGITQL
jgi:hypothetical protein